MEKTSSSRQEQSVYNPILTASTGTTNAAFAAALTAIGSANTTLLLSPIDGAGALSTWVISANQTVPRNVTLRVPRGALLSVNTGVTLTINGPVVADDPDWYSGLGTVTFGTIALASEERYHTQFPTGYVISGGLHATSGSTTTATFACQAVSSDGRHWTQSAAAVTYSGGNGTYWLIGHKNTTTALTGWTRQSGTHYLWKVSSSQPTLPSASVLLAKVTVAGSAVTVVQDYRKPASFARQGWYDVTDPLYGATGDGVTNDTTAIQAAFNAGKSVFFPEGTYWLGAHSLTADRMIDLSALGDGIRVLTQGQVTLTCTSSGAGAFPKFFYLYNNNNFYCQPLRFEDLGYAASVNGAVAFYLSNLTTAVDWGNCTFESITGTNIGAGMFIAANPVSATTRIRGIHIGTLNLSDAYYGFNCQNDGDSVTIDSMTTYRVIRSYYCYGVAGHTVSKLFARYPRPSTGQVLIARQVGGLDTRGITINYVCRDAGADFTTNFYHVSFQHIDLLGGEISDCTIDINIDDTAAVNYYPVSFLNYTGSGGSETAGASANYVKDIRLSGSCNGYSLGPYVVATYANKRQMHFTPGYNFLTNAALATAFQLCQLSRATAGPVWTAVTVNPALGNGTLTYDVDIAEGMMQLSLHLTIGSTTTTGTGGWIFDQFLPAFTATATSTGTWVALDSGTAFYTGVCKISATTDNIICFYNTGTDTVKSTIPFTWAAGDTLDLTIRFPIS